MKIFEITKDGKGYTKEAETLAQATAWANTYLISGYKIEEVGTLPELTPEQKAERHRTFGQLLFDTFLNDNAIFAAARGSNFTIQETMELKAKFGDFGELCKYGSIPQIQLLLPSIQPDAIVSQERLDKYIEMVNNHLAS